MEQKKESIIFKYLHLPNTPNLQIYTRPYNLLPTLGADTRGYLLSYLRKSFLILKPVFIGCISCYVFKQPCKVLGIFEA